MMKRLTSRGITSGRSDDNIESIVKRFAVFKEQSYPVIEYYQRKNKVERVSCMNSVDGVYKETREIIERMVLI